MGRSRQSICEVTSPQGKNNSGMSRVDLWAWLWEEERYMPSCGAPERASGGGRSGKAAEGSEGPRVQEPAQHGPESEASDVNARAHGFKSPQSWSCTPPPIPPQCPAPVMQSCSTVTLPLPLKATEIAALCLCSHTQNPEYLSSQQTSCSLSSNVLTSGDPVQCQVPLEILKTVM